MPHTATFYLFFSSLFTILTKIFIHLEQMKSLHNFLNRLLHEVVGFAPTILLTALFRVNIFILKGVNYWQKLFHISLWSDSKQNKLHDMKHTCNYITSGT